MEDDAERASLKWFVQQLHDDLHREEGDHDEQTKRNPKEGETSKTANMTSGCNGNKAITLKSGLTPTSTIKWMMPKMPIMTA